MNITKRAVVVAVVGLAGIGNFLGWGHGVVGYIAERSAWLGNGDSGISGKDTMVLVGADGGSSLQEYGLKYAFLDNLTYAGMWRWGVARKYAWTMLEYEVDGAKRKITIPLRGTVGWDNGQRSTETRTFGELSKELRRGERIGFVNEPQRAQSSPRFWFSSRSHRTCVWRKCCALRGKFLSSKIGLQV